jgi:hypothetical protein
MSLHIKKFVERLQALESRNAKEFVCGLQDARDLHSDITRLLLELEHLQARLSKEESVIQIELAGGKF